MLLNAARCELLLSEPDPPAGSPAVSPAAPTVVRVDENDEVHRNERSHAAVDWVAAKALHSCGSTLLHRTDKDTDVGRWLEARHAELALVVPLRAGDKPFGVVSALDRLGEASRFNRDDPTLLQTLAGYLALSIARTRTLERLSFDATHDALTGLANRGYLDDRLLSATTAGAVDVAVLLLDLDKFKDVNDVLGHDVGDRLLIVVADRLRDAVGGDAVVTRLGGDELAVLLTDLGPAALVGQRLPVTELKIDRSFVSAISADSVVDTHRLLTSIVGLGQNIGLRIVAEGIETEHQRTTLASIGCDVGQGYLVSKPLSPIELQSWLGDRHGTV